MTFPKNNNDFSRLPDTPRNRAALETLPAARAAKLGAVHVQAGAEPRAGHDPASRAGSAPDIPPEVLASHHAVDGLVVIARERARAWHEAVAANRFAAPEDRRYAQAMARRLDGLADLLLAQPGARL